MAESQAAPPSAAAAAEQDVLLATKLYLPRLQPGFVARPRLLDQLGRALGRDLILVCAPAGSARRPCWLTGRARAGGRSPGCHWTPETTTRRGSGAMSSLRWIRCARG